MSDRIHLYQSTHFSFTDLLSVVDIAVTESKKTLKYSVVALPSVALATFVFRTCQSLAKNDKLLTMDLSVPNIAPDITIISTFSKAADTGLVPHCGSLYIPFGYLVATNEHICSINKLFAEAQIANVDVHIFLAPIPSSSVENESIISELCSRFRLPCSSFDDNPKPPSEVILSCSLSDGVEVVHGAMPYMKQVERSNCPLTDCLISIITHALKEKKSCMVVCANDFEANGVADRLSMEFYEELRGQKFLENHVNLFAGIKVIGGVMLITGSPFSEKHGDLALKLMEVCPLITVGCRRNILYSGYKAEYVINMVYTEIGPMNFAERLMLFCLTDQQGCVFTVTDNVASAFEQYSHHPRVFNKLVIQLINEGKSNISEISAYFNNFITANVDLHGVIDDLLGNGALTEYNGVFEIHGCKYLSGFFGIEKRRLLEKAFCDFNLQNTLYHFYLANLFFVDSKALSGLSKTAIHNILSLPVVKKLSDQVGLHDPKMTSSYFSKCESSLLLSSICYLHYSNGSVNGEPLIYEIDLFDGINRLFDLLQMNRRNINLTAEICQDLYGSVPAQLFKQLAGMCLLFDTSSLQCLSGVDLVSIDSLTLAGVKTLGQLVHCANLEKHVRILAKKQGLSPRTCASELRRKAISITLKSFDGNTSKNNSRDLFSTSFVGDDMSFKSLCVLDEPCFENAFQSPSPSEVIILHLSNQELLKIIRITTKIDLFQIRLRCCDDCFLGDRIGLLISECEKAGTIVVSNVLSIGRQLMFLGFSTTLLSRAHCLSCMFYVIGNHGVTLFIDTDKRFMEYWRMLHNCIVLDEPLTQDVVQSITSIIGSISHLLNHDMVLKVRTAISRLIQVYHYGIPYCGFHSLRSSYLGKYNTFPKNVQTAANSKFIPVDLHLEIADDASSLLQYKKNKTKLLSTGDATENQSSIFYAQLSKLRKLNQAIDLLSEKYFLFDSGYVFPAIDFGRSGRLYTRAPNLQNFAKSLPFTDLKSPRSLVCVDDDHEIWSADYCEMELRMTALLSQDGSLFEALESPDVFETIARKLGLIEESRADVKLFFYGLLYGMGSQRLEEYGFEQNFAKSLWKKFSESFPKLAEYREFLRQKVINNDIITDYYGKPVTVEIESAHVALNTVVQSSCAFLLLNAVSKMDTDSVIKLLFLVHDEVVLLAPKSLHSEVSKIVKSWMETKLDDVNFPIKLKFGSSWDNLIRI